MAAPSKPFRPPKRPTIPGASATSCSVTGTRSRFAGIWMMPIRILERGLALSRDRDFPLLLTIIGGTLGYARVLSGDVQEGLALMEPAGRTVLSAWAAAATRATVWLGEAYLSAGRIDDAATAAKRAHDLAEEK